MRLPVGLLLLAYAALGYSATGAAFAVRLVTTLSSPQPVGTAIGLSPRLENVAKGTINVRYELSVNGGPFHIVRDFSQLRDFAWAPALYEHAATIRVTVRNNETKETAQVETPFQIMPRVTGATATVAATSHPLIALFSAAPCPEGSQFRVVFHPEGEDVISRTPEQACRGSITNNVLVAGMRADTEYKLRPEVITAGKEKRGDWLSFRTGILDGEQAPVSVSVPRLSGSVASEPVVIFSAASAGAGTRPFATDLQGRVIWYLRNADFLTRVLPGGRFLVLAVDGQNTANPIRRYQALRLLDLAGNIIRETNVGRVAEQLESRGIHSDCKKGGKECLSGFHHEAIALPNGHFLAVTGLERMMPAGTQGSKEPVDILGDVIVELDEDFQVAGMWNNFDRLDVNRASRYDSKCKEGAGAGGCAAVFLASEANGWTHSNAINYIPSSGDFLVSMPDQNWVIKVDYKNGKGSGKILWRLGEEGDFKAKSDDPNPWFSYQHDAGFDPPGSDMLTIFDNGHVRFDKDKTAQTRGQKWQLDEKNLTATLVYNAKLEVYSAAVGAAQTLKNGGYSFNAGYIDNATSPFGRAVETDRDGRVVFAIDAYGTLIYRSFRVDDVYSAPAKTPVK
jgi:arylsulfate sulfotransferase